MHEYQDFVIGELVEAGVVSSPDMERARARASESHVSVLEAVVELDLASARDVAIVRASVCECAYVDVEHYVIDFKNTSLAPASVARKHMAFPLFDTGEVVTLGMADPLDLNAVDQIRSIVKREVEPVLCEPEALERLIERAYSLTSSGPEAQGAAAVEQGSGRGAEPRRTPLPPARIGGTAECDLRGLRVEEALDRLDAALDEAAAAGRDELRVIHGIGTGALRRAWRDGRRRDGETGMTATVRSLPGNWIARRSPRFGRRCHMPRFRSTSRWIPMPSSAALPPCRHIFVPISARCWPGGFSTRGTRVTVTVSAESLSAAPRR